MPAIEKILVNNHVVTQTPICCNNMPYNVVIEMSSKLFKKLRMFFKDIRGSTPASVKAGIIIGISLFVVAVVFPLAMTQITSANTTGWNAGVTTLFTVLLPVLGIVGIALKYLSK